MNAENQDKKSTQKENDSLTEQQDDSSKQEEQEEIKLDMKDVNIVKCSICKGEYFTIIYKIVVISKSLPVNKTGQDITKPMPYFKCIRKKCGGILKDIRPM